METLSIREGRNRLPEIYKRVVNQNDQFMLSDIEGKMVIVSLHEWESVLETLRLLRDKSAFKALLQSFVDHDQGQKSGKSFEDVFAELL